MSRLSGCRQANLGRDSSMTSGFHTQHSQESSDVWKHTARHLQGRSGIPVLETATGFYECMSARGCNSKPCNSLPPLDSGQNYHLCCAGHPDRPCDQPHLLGLRILPLLFYLHQEGHKNAGKRVLCQVQVSSLPSLSFCGTCACISRPLMQQPHRLSPGGADNNPEGCIMLIFSLILLRELPCRMGCILIRLHQRLRTNMVMFFALSLALLHFVHLDSCRSFIETWGGLLPVQVSSTRTVTLAVMRGSSLLKFQGDFGWHTSHNKGLCCAQIVLTAMVCCWAHLMTPADPRKSSPVLGVCKAPLCSVDVMQPSSLLLVSGLSCQSSLALSKLCQGVLMGMQPAYSAGYSW